MKITYKNPYWMKFQWEINDHHDDQYVTIHDKELNEEFDEFFYKSQFAIHIDFKIKDYYVMDEHFMLVGKPTKNIGLVYKQKTNELFFMFRLDNGDEKRIYVPNITNEELSNGITITIIRDIKKFIVYKNLIEVGSLTFDGNICNRYRDTALYVGCSSTLSDVVEYRWYGEMNLNSFLIVENNSDISVIKEIIETQLHELPRKKFYGDLLCYYDFKTINNLGIIYDESRNNNFLELIPEDFKL